MKWVTITGPLAVCDIQGEGGYCDWGMNGDTISSQELHAAARRHVRETGHSVIFERGQTAHLRPDA